MGFVRRVTVAVTALCVLGVSGRLEPAEAQRLTGKLLSRIDDRPISLGLVILSSVQGDSVDSALTDENGNFELEAREGGSFLLVASALGFREAADGVFDIPSGSSMTVEFRLDPQAITLDGLLVHAETYRQEPALVRNGFYRRLQRGMGRYLTPEDIEASAALETADLFYGLPGVRVTPTDFGDASITMRGTQGRYCRPALFVDGVYVRLNGSSLRDVVPLRTIAAAEVYAGTTAIPIEYATFSSCGVLVIWTRT